MTIERQLEKIQETLKADDHAGVIESCNAFMFELTIRDTPIDPKLAKKVLLCLRDTRCFQLLRSLAQAIINDGCNTIDVIKLYAQGLIDTGELDPATAILEQHLESADLGDANFADAFGVLGRAWKEKALKTRDIRNDLCKLATQKAYEAYEAPYRHNTTRFYQGINLVGMAHWDKGRSLSALQLKFATETATNILNQLSARTVEELPVWDIATAGEAALAIGQIDTAAQYFGQYVDHEGVNVFQLAGTVRQLTDLWQLDDTEPGRQLLAPLRAKLLQSSGGSFSASPQAIRDMESVPKESYEKVLGRFGAMTYHSLMTALAKARSVAMFKDAASGRTFGYRICRGWEAIFTHL